SKPSHVTKTARFLNNTLNYASVVKTCILLQNPYLGTEPSCIIQHRFRVHKILLRLEIQQFSKTQQITVYSFCHSLLSSHSPKEDDKNVFNPDFFHFEPFCFHEISLKKKPNGFAKLFPDPHLQLYCNFISNPEFMHIVLEL
ncbi:unnamed protein product, partial [Owenia fusiformis]